jgi:CsoR family transcriptional regulator, copper-sensing transcriptional repressor
MEPPVDVATPAHLLATDPGTTDPATTDPATTDPATTDPATTGDGNPVDHADHDQAGHDQADDDQAAGHDHQWGYSDHKDAYQKRLRRIEGQVRGLQRMIDEDKYCIDIVTQVSAVTRALQSVALELIEEHLGHCVAQAIVAGGAEAEDKVKEASAAVARLVRS